MASSGNATLRASLAVSVLVAASCRPPVQYGFDPIDRGAVAYDTTVQVRFLGVGGFLIRRGEDVVLTAPLYSNPDRKELEGPLRPKVDLIEKFNRHVADVNAVLVGHAHYDHLMDVPFVLGASPNAMIYGNESVAYVLNGYTNGSTPHIRAEQIRALNMESDNLVDYRMCAQREGPPSLAPNRESARGSWVHIPGSRIRIRALCSEHPPQIMQLVHLWPGRVYRPRFAPPLESKDYQEGETLAYLIDFLDEGGTKPVFRVYYQDAPTPPTIGEVAPELLEEKPVDLALLCVGNFMDVQDPAHIVRNTRPSHIILGHWENFLEPQRDNPPQIPFANVKKVLKVVREAAGPETEVILPNPQAVFRFSSSP